MKQQEVTQSFSSKGYALSGEAYDRAMRKAKAEDNQSSTPSSEVDPKIQAEVTSFMDKIFCCCSGDNSDIE